MKKKVFTLALLAVFVLAQFSLASATAESGAVTALEPLPTFHNAGDITLDWSVTGMDGTGTQNLFLWARSATSAHADWDPAANFCYKAANLDTLTNANGTYVFHTDNTADDDQDVVEFMATVSDQADCPAAFAEVSASDPAQASTFIDAYGVYSWSFNYPSLLNNIYFYDTASCNTFEMWALGSDSFLPISYYNTGPGYSGIKAWNPTTTGTFAPPAPQGSEGEIFSWVFTFPATASGEWSFRIMPEDYAGNTPIPEPLYSGYWRYGPVVPDVTAAELEECANFSDVSGDDNEVYIRYLADLGLISGFADGTFGLDNSLTRAEAATLFEISNGYDDTILPPSAPAGCEFTDVSASDWFAGWVWQACADGFMNGIGGGLFDPNNLLTRGQVVTIFNNIHNIVPPYSFPMDNYLDSASLLNVVWGIPAPYPIRSSAWSDVAIGDYYAEGVVQAYGWGVAEGTSEGTFSPNAPITRGLFAKWLYRALSRAT